MYKTIHSISQRLLPSWLYERLIGNWDKTGFKKYFANTSWVFLAKMVTFLVSFLTMALVARYLGPENYGKLSYSQSFVAIFSIFATLGIDQILYRDLIAHKEKEKEILGTAFIAKAFFGLITFIVTCAVAYYVNDDIILTWLICITALTFIFQPWGVLSHYFNAHVAAKYTSIAAILIAFIIPALKLLVIYFEQGIIYFASILAFEACFLAVYNITVYALVFDGNPLSWRYTTAMLISLLRDSWPLLLSGFAGYIYGRIDQVMIQHTLDSASVGIYDAAVRLTEISGFLPNIFIASLFPAIINARSSNSNEYIKRFHTLSLFSIGLAGIISVLMYLLSPYIIRVLFGSEFSGSVGVLQIYCWSLIGGITVALMQTYLIAENRARKILILTAFGAIFNIILNSVLIPNYGIYGAAYATLSSYAMIIILFLLTERSNLMRIKFDTK